MTAPISENDLHAWADSRLDGDRRARVEGWLAAHPEARMQAEAWRAQDARLHRAYDAVLEEAVPARLLSAVRNENAGMHFMRLPMLRIAAVAAWVGLGGLLGYALHGREAPPDKMLALSHQAAVAYAVYSPEVKHPVEVGKEQEAHLAAWLSKRLGAELKPPRLEAEGFALMGGRLLPGPEAGEPVAQFMYQGKGNRRLTLYVRKVAENSRAKSNDTAFRFAREGNISVFYWIEGSFGYALSGEIEREELLRVSTDVYRQLTQSPT